MKSESDDDKIVRGVQSIEVGLILLSILAKHRTPQMLKSLAAEADMPPSKAHRYLVSFIRAGLVQQIGTRYLLGLGALQLGLAVMGTMDVVGIALERLQTIRDDVGETVGLVVWTPQGPTYVRVIESNRTVSVNSRSGSVLSLLHSASGSVFVTYLPESKTSQLIEGELAASVKRGKPISPAHLEKIRKQTRQYGLGRVRGDYFPGIGALSAPIFDYSGELVAAITALGPQEALDLRYDGDLARQLKSHALKISEELGYEVEGK